MYKITFALLAVLLIFSCKKDEIAVTKHENIDYSMSSNYTDIDLGEQMSVTITRKGDHVVETELRVNFYISADGEYSSDDILIPPDKSATFGPNDNTELIDLTIPQSLKPGKFYLVALFIPLNLTSSTNYKSSSIPLTVNVPIALLSFSGFLLSSTNKLGKDTSGTFDRDSTVYYFLPYIYASVVSGTLYYEIYLSDDNNFNESNDLKIKDDISYLSTTNRTVTGTFGISASGHEGEYTLFAKAYYYRLLASNVGSQKMYLPVISRRFKVIQ